jgi:RNA polymerase sigma factor (sigma-70 family)
VEWFKHSTRRLKNLLRRRGWRRQDMEDVIQDAFLRMHVYCREGGEVRNPEAFLVRTTLNLAINQKTRSRAHLFVEAPVEDAHASLALALEPAPEEVLAAEERLGSVLGRIAAMTPRTREIFLLHYVDEYTYPQIARQLGISVSAVEKHMARGMLVLTEGQDDT